MSNPAHDRCAFCGSPASSRPLAEGPSAAICERCAQDALERLRAPRSAAAVGRGSADKPVAVIPARFASSRFPGKPLALLAGKPMIQHVHQRCMDSGAFSRVIVATDDARIAEAARGFGAEVELTSEHCKSGTDRVAEVAQRIHAEAYVNVQGDEPLIHPDVLRAVAQAFADVDVEMATLIRPLEDEERSNPNVVKVVLGRSGDALYFSRADIPFEREPNGFPPRYAHLGLYGYRRHVLLALSKMAPSPLEETEKLEQLRALENGYRIRCLTTMHRSVGVDTPADLSRAEALLQAPTR